MVVYPASVTITASHLRAQKSRVSCGNSPQTSDISRSVILEYEYIIPTYIDVPYVWRTYMTRSYMATRTAGTYIVVEYRCCVP